MNNTARIQASFSLPEVLLEDKIERMGKNQTKMIIPKKRRAVKSSIPRVYAVQLLLCPGLCPVTPNPHLFWIVHVYVLFRENVIEGIMGVVRGGFCGGW
jgi:hypothetical protein